jgi:hypothetical protein
MNLGLAIPVEPCPPLPGLLYPNFFLSLWTDLQQGMSLYRRAMRMQNISEETFLFI